MPIMKRLTKYFLRTDCGQVPSFPVSWENTFLIGNPEVDLFVIIQWKKVIRHIMQYTRFNVYYSEIYLLTLKIQQTFFKKQ